MSIASIRLTYLFPPHVPVHVRSLRGDFAVLLIGNASRRARRWVVYEVGGNRYKLNYLAVSEVGDLKRGISTGSTVIRGHLVHVLCSAWRLIPGKGTQVASPYIDNGHRRLLPQTTRTI